MNYSWDIKQWIKMVLASLLRKPKRVGILQGIVAAIKDTANTTSNLYNQFIDFKDFINLRVRYNCQQGSLTALLNKLFDPELKRIYLVTQNDTKVTIYGKLAADGSAVPTIYGKLAADGSAVPTIHGYTATDYANTYNGYVYVPSTLAPREAEIRKWIELNIFLGKTYEIIYF